MSPAKKCNGKKLRGPKHERSTTGHVVLDKTRFGRSPRGERSARCNMADPTDEDVATAIRVIKAACSNEGLREKLQPAVGQFNKRQRQQQRQRSAAKKGGATPAEQPAACAPIASVEGVITLAPPHLSRPLYLNPVCFLSTWVPGGRRNLMTISWLMPVDNDGTLICSMNQRRHSARLLACHLICA